VYWTFSRYKNIPTITVSQSTAKELRERFNFTDISVVENATHIQPIKKINWENKKKEIVFLGRITEMKRVHEAIKAFHILSLSDKQYELNII
jgi:glycosyltransferase involved in cell wall biosynthesis